MLRIHDLTTAAGVAAGLLSATAGAGWQPVLTYAPHQNGGVMILMSDGTVLCKTYAGSSDGYGNTWDRLTPALNGSYSQGTWSSVAPMINSRLYFSSQVLRDGRLYVAGGEYGTGLAAGEVYDPLTNTWTLTPAPGANVSDANSEILPDGRVLQALVAGSLTTNLIWNPATNTYSAGPSCLGIHNESTWTKLPDNSFIMVDRHALTAERYVPASNTWVRSADCPVPMYDDFGYETGGALLLPDGRVFFMGGTGRTAYYTGPAAGQTLGSWTTGPDIPGGRGVPDGPASMLPNGKVFLVASPAPTSADHFPLGSTFYEFNPSTGVYTAVIAPGGVTIHDSSTYVWTFLSLPDGSVLACQQGSRTYWRWVSDGAPQDAWRPAVTGMRRDPASGVWTITGRQLNGMGEGSSYGDDWQMNTNYPVVRLVNAAGNTYWGRTFNWSSTGVQTGSQVVTTQMTLPATVPPGTYQMYVAASGISSLPKPLFNPKPSCPADLNVDGVVDGFDLGTLLSAWGLPGSPATGAGDLDGSGVVDGSDLGLLLSAWGTCPP